MIQNKISKEIVARKKPNKIVTISICGAADLGKSFLSKAISESLSKVKLKVAHLTLDSYLMDRTIRKEKGLSGYEIGSYDIINARKDFITLKSGKPIKFHSYDHLSGKSSSKPSKMDTADIVILDGLHSMHPSFMSHIDMAVFVYTHDEYLKKIRSEADLIKRNYTSEYSHSISENEFNLYKTNIEPYRKNADYLIFLKSKWNYNFKHNDFNLESK